MVKVTIPFVGGLTLKNLMSFKDFQCLLKKTLTRTEKLKIGGATELEGSHSAKVSYMHQYKFYTTM